MDLESLRNTCEHNSRRVDNVSKHCVSCATRVMWKCCDTISLSAGRRYWAN